MTLSRRILSFAKNERFRSDGIILIVRIETIEYIRTVSRIHEMFENATPFQKPPDRINNRTLFQTI